MVHETTACQEYPRSSGGDRPLSVLGKELTTSYVSLNFQSRKRNDRKLDFAVALVSILPIPAKPLCPACLPSSKS